MNGALTLIIYPLWRNGGSSKTTDASSFTHRLNGHQLPLKLCQSSLTKKKWTRHDGRVLVQRLWLLFSLFVACSLFPSGNCGNRVNYWVCILSACNERGDSCCHWASVKANYVNISSAVYLIPIMHYNINFWQQLEKRRCGWEANNIWRRYFQISVSKKWKDLWRFRLSRINVRGVFFPYWEIWYELPLNILDASVCMKKLLLLI